jgi:deazaflavin-dependent oxidoreductase (nitroreductase family)
MTTAAHPAQRRPQHAVRTFNKYAVNRVMGTVAGRQYWFAASLHHSGRYSSRAYTTPVIAQPVPEGFVIPLPYGTRTDWLRNVLAAGRATIDVRGRHYTLVEPEVLNTDAVSPMLPVRLQRIWRRFHIGRYLRMWVLPDGGVGSDF